MNSVCTIINVMSLFVQIHTSLLVPFHMHYYCFGDLRGHSASCPTKGRHPKFLFVVTNLLYRVTEPSRSNSDTSGDHSRHFT